jgi:hypothetical protein
MILNYIYKYRLLIIAVTGYFLVWGVFIALRRLRGIRIPIPSKDDLKVLFNEIEMVPLDNYFSGRVDSTSNNLGIFKDHIDRYFAKISELAKQYRLSFYVADLFSSIGSHGYIASEAYNVIQGDSNELLVKRSFYDGGRHGTRVFRVELEVILSEDVYLAFHRHSYLTVLSEFEASVVSEDVRTAILNSLQQAVYDQFHFLR